MAELKTALFRGVSIAAAALVCVTTLSNFAPGTANAVPAKHNIPTPHQAAIFQAATRIDIAERQQMLSQRMAKATCLFSTGIDSYSYKAQLEEAYQLFKASDMALRHGDAALQLAPETKPEILAALLRTDASWDDYEAHVEKALTRNRVSLAEIVAMDRAGQSYLAAASEATDEIAMSYGVETSQIMKNLIVGVIGRQRTFSQKIVKDICLMRHVDAPEPYADHVQSANQTFDKTLSTLKLGDPALGIPAPSSPQIKAHYQRMDALWATMKPVIEATSPQARLSDKELSDLALKSEEMLEMMDQLVALIQHQSQRSEG